MSAQLDDITIAKVGKALRQVAEIKETYSERMATASSENERQELVLEAEDAAVEALDEQGLTVERYAAVLTAAEEDPDLEERLVAAARDG